MNKEHLREMVLEQLSPIVETLMNMAFDNLEHRLRERQDWKAPVEKDEILTFKEVLQRYKISATAFEVTIRRHGLQPGQAVKKGNRRFLKSDCDRVLINKIL